MCTFKNKIFVITINLNDEHNIGFAKKLQYNFRLNCAI